MGVPSTFGGAGHGAFLLCEHEFVKENKLAQREYEEHMGKHR